MSVQKLTHPEWVSENTLTDPEDRDRDSKWKPNQGLPSLSETEAEAAMATQIDKTNLDEFRRIERRYVDPAVPMQNYTLVSFVPSKGAKPNANGVYGWCKVRGSYSDLRMADERAEDLLRNTDSYHKIYTTRTGHPFPMTTVSDFSGDVKEVDVRKDLSESVSASIRGKKKEEHEVVTEITDREKMLRDESVPENKNPMDTYITLNVKRAQVAWTYLETKKKMDEMKNTILSSRAEIEKMDQENAIYREKYFQRYAKAREGCGLDTKVDDTSFMKFLCVSAEDDLGF